jgi:hypothetical protein
VGSRCWESLLLPSRSRAQKVELSLALVQAVHATNHQQESAVSLVAGTLRPLLPIDLRMVAPVLEDADLLTRPSRREESRRDDEEWDAASL